MTTWYHLYLYCIVVIKCIFVFLAILDKFFHVTKHLGMESIVSIWKQRFESLFLLTMSWLCIGLFHPWRKNPTVLDPLTSFLFLMFGCVVFFQVFTTFTSQRKKNQKEKQKKSD